MSEFVLAHADMHAPHGTMAVPCFDVTMSCVGPPPTGRNLATLSTGAQSLSSQHSFGYQPCASIGVREDNAVPARSAMATTTMDVVFMVDAADGDQRRHHSTRMVARRHMFI